MFWQGEPADSALLPGCLGFAGYRREAFPGQEADVGLKLVRSRFALLVDTHHHVGAVAGQVETGRRDDWARFLETLATEFSWGREWQ